MPAYMSHSDWFREFIPYCLSFQGRCWQPTTKQRPPGGNKQFGPSQHGSRISRADLLSTGPGTIPTWCARMYDSDGLLDLLG